MDSIFFDSPARSKRWLVFSVAIATFFLMCHGLLGSSHALGSAGMPTSLSDGVAQSHQISGHGAIETQDAGEIPSHSTGWGLVYASVIVISALGALILFSLIRTHSAFGLTTSHRRRGGFTTPKGLNPCRGPTLPTLQVFRL